MAERRIIRRNHQIMQNKNRENPSVIPEEDEESHRTEKTIISKPKDATVEVTVKVKKRRDKSIDSTGKLIPLHEKEYPKGSWGDLLSGSRISLSHKDDEGGGKKQKDEFSHDIGKMNLKRGNSKNHKKHIDTDHSPLCQKIPLSDDLYLETHTHIKKSQSTDRYDSERTLLKQNEELRKEIHRLRREVEVSKIRYGNNTRLTSMKATPVSSKAWNFDEEETKAAYSKGQTQGTQTSTTCLLSPKKVSKGQMTETDGAAVRRAPASSSTKSSFTDIRNKPAETSIPVELIQLETMRLQNEELRQQIAKLLNDINQTRSENCEFVSTIKELHQTADALTRANRELQEKHNLLILNHHGQQALQEQLLQIVTHNVQMKETLENLLLNKQNSPTGIDDNQLAQFRNVIKDVKSTIAQEMQGLATLSSPKSAFFVEKANSAFQQIGDSSLNDTNASEIRRILATQPSETRRGRNVQEDRSSSTQYLNLEGFTAIDSNFSMSLSQVDVSAMSHSSKNVAGKDSEDEWKALGDEVSRSFIPVLNELSNCSTSSYSSGSSSISSPNPMMMKQ